MTPMRPAVAVLFAFTAALGGCSSNAGDAPLLVSVAASTAVPADGSFYPFLCGGAVAGDVVGDSLTGGGFRDIVGDGEHPAFYRAANATHVFFRMRVSGDPRKPGSTVLQPSSWDVLVDTDGDPSTYEFMLTADGNFDSTTRVQWVRNSVKEPNDPDGSGERRARRRPRRARPRERLLERDPGGRRQQVRR